MQRIYREARTVPFTVRVHEKRGSEIKRLATRLGVSEVEASLIVETGLKALQAA